MRPGDSSRLKRTVKWTAITTLLAILLGGFWIHLGGFWVYGGVWYPLMYWGEEIRGRVVDAETGQPLEGVVIVAQWILYLPGQGSVGRLKVLEAVTDKEGHYHIPGWGPKFRPPFTYLDSNMDPMLIVFKGGYKPLRLLNHELIGGRIDQRKEGLSHRTSDYHGETLKLERFVGSEEEWVKELDRVLSRLGIWFTDFDNVEKILEVLNSEKQQLSSRVLNSRESKSFFDRLDHIRSRKYRK